jgi:hypothetical protein
MDTSNPRFKPRIRYFEIEYCLHTQNPNGIEISNDCLYSLVKRLADSASPTSADQHDKRWVSFYVPMKRDGKLISIPLDIVEYNNTYYCFFKRIGTLGVKPGNEKYDRFFSLIFREALRYFQIIKRTGGGIVQRTVPYDIRTGKILGKYLMTSVMSQKEKKKLAESYISNQKSTPQLSRISLNEYLEVCTICYKAAFGMKTRPLSPVEMYRRWADGRDGEMLSIKDWNNKDEFTAWYEGHKWLGSHPFEIVFSWSNIGIQLFPPEKDTPEYVLDVSNYACADRSLKMIDRKSVV